MSKNRIKCHSYIQNNMMTHGYYLKYKQTRTRGPCLARAFMLVIIKAGSDRSQTGAKEALAHKYPLTFIHTCMYLHLLHHQPRCVGSSDFGFPVLPKQLLL